MFKRISAFAMMAAVTSMAVAAPAGAQQYRQEISNDMGKCRVGEEPAMLVSVNGIKSGTGTLRVQSYRATSGDWLESGRWLNRIEAPARRGTMTFCMPLPAEGTYGIAVRHDVNGNGKTDLTKDGGGMSNNPSINIFNLGKPSYKKTGVAVGQEIKSIRIDMKYM